MTFITLTPDNLAAEHICCALSDPKCAEGYALKKQWLAQAFASGHVLRRLDARAKVFIEYGPAEQAWVPVAAPGYLMLGCFWVSGRYKGQGHGQALLQQALDAARQQNMRGLVTVAGTKKRPFMSDTRWLCQQGFAVVDTTPAGFALLALHLGDAPQDLPRFNASARSGLSATSQGLVAVYSNRCPFTEYHVRTALVETAQKRQLPLKVIQLTTLAQAQRAPSPATIFSLFLDGRFITTDLSVCMDSRFDTLVAKSS